MKEASETVESSGKLKCVGAVALGYLEGEEPKAAPRKEGYIVEVR